MAIDTSIMRIRVVVNDLEDSALTAINNRYGALATIRKIGSAVESHLYGQDHPREEAIYEASCVYAKMAGADPFRVRAWALSPHEQQPAWDILGVKFS